MNNIELSTRCTREEYMDFAVQCGKTHWWTTAAGGGLLLLGAAVWVLSGRPDTLGLLLLFAGVTAMLADPLLLPLLRKGEAARRYDRSDSLKGAITLRLDDTSLYIRTSGDEGTLPLDAMTDVKRTKGMTALCFGQELTVCIPHRALRAEEEAALEAILAQRKKEAAV